MHGKKKKLNQNVILLDLKIIGWITDAKYARENLPSQ